MNLNDANSISNLTTRTLSTTLSIKYSSNINNYFHT